MAGSSRKAIRRLLELYTVRHTLRNEVRRLRNERMSVTSSEGVIIDLDGQRHGMLPVALKVVPQAVNIQIPAETLS